MRLDRARQPLQDVVILGAGIPPGINVRAGETVYDKYRRCTHCNAYILKDLFPEQDRDAFFAPCVYCGKLTRNHARNKPRGNGGGV